MNGKRSDVGENKACNHRIKESTEQDNLIWCAQIYIYSCNTLQTSKYLISGTATEVDTSSRERSYFLPKSRAGGQNHK